MSSWHQLANVKLTWQLMTTCNSLRQLMTAYDSLWQLIKAYDSILQLLTTYDSIWQHMTAYDSLGQLMTSFDSLWQLLTALHSKWELITAFDSHPVWAAHKNFAVLVFLKLDRICGNFMKRKPGAWVPDLGPRPVPELDKNIVSSLEVQIKNSPKSASEFDSDCFEIFYPLPPPQIFLCLFFKVSVYQRFNMHTYTLSDVLSSPDIVHHQKSRPEVTSEEGDLAPRALRWCSLDCPWSGIIFCITLAKTKS